MPAKKVATDVAVTAARRVRDLYNKNQDDPRYQANMTGAGAKNAPTTDTVNIPRRKIYNATQLANAADAAGYPTKPKKGSK